MMITRQISTLKELEPAAITDPIEARIRADGKNILSVVQSLRMMCTVEFERSTTGRGLRGEGRRGWCEERERARARETSFIDNQEVTEGRKVQRPDNQEVTEGRKVQRPIYIYKPTSL
jgi:hypothetical protein